MRKISIIILLIIASGFLSALYMQLNLFQGEPHIFQPHEYKPEVTKLIDQKDRYFMPLWAMIFAVTILLGYLTLQLLVSKHSYYNTGLYLLMISIYLTAVLILFKAYSVVGRAQALTGKTAEFVVGFVELLAPVMLILGLCGINELIKNYNVRIQPDTAAVERFKTLQDILRKKHLE